MRLGQVHLEMQVKGSPPVARVQHGRGVSLVPDHRHTSPQTVETVGKEGVLVCTVDAPQRSKCPEARRLCRKAASTCVNGRDEAADVATTQSRWDALGQCHSAQRFVKLACGDISALYS